MASFSIAAIAATVIGAGVSAYGAYSSGQQQKVLSDYNAQQQEKQAQTQALSIQVQAALKKQQAEANFRLRSAESQARMVNAKNLETQALAQDRINAVNMGKRRMEFARAESTQRAVIAESGVVESSGTPLDLLAETAGVIQKDAEEQQFANEQSRRTLFSEAAQERLGGKLALAGATLDRDSSLAAASLEDTAAKGTYLAGIREAEISRLTGGAASTAGMYSAAGTLLSGVASAGKQYATAFPTIPKAGTVYSAS